MATDLFTHLQPWTWLAVFGLLGVTWLVSAWQKLGIEKDLLWSAARATVQLGLMGLVLAWLFALDQPAMLLLFLLLMVLMAGGFNAKRGKGITHAYWIGVASIGISTTTTLALLLGSGLISLHGKMIIPLGGMIIGNAMNAVSLALERLRHEVDGQEDLLVAMAALGASHRQILQHIYPMVVRAALIPTIDGLKSVGLIHIPGISAGMILAGTPPLEAVGMQLLVMFMLTAAVSLATISAVILAGPATLHFRRAAAHD